MCLAAHQTFANSPSKVCIAQFLQQPAWHHKPAPAQCQIGCLKVAYSRFVHMVHAGNVRAARIDDSADRVVFDIHTSATRKATTAAQEAGLAPAESSDPASAGAATGEVPAIVGVLLSLWFQYICCIVCPSAALLSPQQFLKHGLKILWLLQIHCAEG